MIRNGSGSEKPGELFVKFARGFGKALERLVGRLTRAVEMICQGIRQQSLYIGLGLQTVRFLRGGKINFRVSAALLSTCLATKEISFVFWPTILV